MSGTVVALLLVSSAAQADVIVHGSTTINMDFVNVDNAGNAADDTGRGAVGYNYRIGKYEVTAAQWEAVRAADSIVGNASWWSGSQPTGSATWYEAAKFCNWLTTGNAATGVYTFHGLITSPIGASIDRTYRNASGLAYFLPTEDEWYKAAYYDPNKGGAGIAGYWDYPTRHDSPSVPDGIDSKGDTAFDAVFWQGYDQARPNSVDNAGLLSAYGTMGQGGNLWEWNETAFGSNRGLRGGFWWSDADRLLASDIYIDYDPENEFNNLSFRVASVPEPASISLMLCGALASLLWWKRNRKR